MPTWLLLLSSLTVIHTTVAVLAGIQAEIEHQRLNTFLNQNGACLL